MADVIVYPSHGYPQKFADQTTHCVPVVSSTFDADGPIVYNKFNIPERLADNGDGTYATIITTSTSATDKIVTENGIAQRYFDQSDGTYSRVVATATLGGTDKYVYNKNGLLEVYIDLTDGTYAQLVGSGTADTFITNEYGVTIGYDASSGYAVAVLNGLSPAFPAYAFAANFLDAPGKVPGFSYTRATVGAMVQQYDGSFVQPLISEIPLRGGRRVHNLLTYSENFSNAAWSKASGGVGATPVGVGDLVTVDGGGGSTATDQSIMSHAVTTVVGVTYTLVVRLAAERPEDVGKIIGLRSVDTGSYTLHTLTADEQTKSVTGVASSTSSFMHIGLRGTHGTSMGEVQFRAKAQLQTGSTASEYISNGVESSPYHGFGVDGVRWFSTDEYGTDLTVEDALGPELVVDFGTVGVTAWQSGSGRSYASIDDGVEINYGSATNAFFYFRATNPEFSRDLTPGRTYTVTVEFSTDSTTSTFPQVEATSTSGDIYASPIETTAASGWVTVSGAFVAGTVGLNYLAAYCDDGTSRVVRWRNLTVREIYPVRCTGMARRPAITNLFEYSNDLSNAAWTKSSCSVSAGAGALGLPGSVVTPSAGTNAPHVYNSTTVVSATNYTLSVLLRGNGTRYVQIFNSVGFNSSLYQNFDLVDGTIEGGNPPIAASIEHVTGDVYLIKYTDVSTGATGRIGIAQVDSGSATRLQTATWDGVDGIEILSSQFEIGSVANDHVPTTSTAVTVNAEVPALVPATIGASSDGVWVIESTPDADSDDQVILAAAGAAGESWSIGATHTVVDGSVTQASIADSWTAGTLIHAVRIEADDVSVDLDGVSVGTDTSATMPTITSITLGGGSTGMGFRRIYYFDPATITDEQKTYLSNGNLPTIPVLA